MLSEIWELFQEKKIEFGVKLQNFGVILGQILKVIESGKLYIKMTLWTTAFQKKRGHEVNKGHPWSKFRK